MVAEFYEEEVYGEEPVMCDYDATRQRKYTVLG